MSESTTQTAPAVWPTDGPLALESYLTALESEREWQSVVSEVLTHMRQRLGLPLDVPPPPSAKEVRSLFARYQEAAPPAKKSIAQMVIDMREE